nr:hypothetical protein Iba_chr10fCG2940 [Ipomoea batatas]
MECGGSITASIFSNNPCSLLSMGATFVGSLKEFSSITLLEVNTVFADPNNCMEFSSNPSMVILSVTFLAPKLTACILKYSWLSSEFFQVIADATSELEILDWRVELNRVAPFDSLKKCCIQ